MFKKASGQTSREYLIHDRVHKAKALLVNTNLSIKRGCLPKWLWEPCSFHYTFRSDPYFLSPDYQGQPLHEYEQFIQLGVDGYFSDSANDGFAARQKAIAGESSHVAPGVNRLQM